MSITIDTRKKCPVIPSPEKTVPEAPAVNGETFKQNVVVKIVPIDNIEGNSSTFTSGSSTATSDENSEQLTSVLKAIVGIPGSDQKFQVLVFINDTYSGNRRLGDISLDSDIIATDGQGDVSETITQSEVKEIPENTEPQNKPAQEVKPEPAEPTPADTTKEADKPTPANKPSDTASPAPMPTDTPALTDGSDSPITDPATPTNPEPVAPSSTGDSKNPEPEEEAPPPSGKGGEAIPVPPTPSDDGEEAVPGPPPPSDDGEEAATDPPPPSDDTDPSVSSSAVSEGAADGEGAETSSAAESAAESG